MKRLPPTDRQARNFEELPDTLVLSEVADLCSMSYSGVIFWVKQAWLPARQARATWLVNKYDLLRFSRERRIPLSFSAVEREF